MSINIGRLFSKATSPTSQLLWGAHRSSALLPACTAAHRAVLRSAAAARCFSSASAAATTTTRLARPSRERPDVSGFESRVCAILGAQWGDEGKGKLVDVLAQNYDIVARFNGGSNAGHTLVVDGKKFAFHLLPCGMLYENKMNVIGNGVVVHVPTLLAELKALHSAGIRTEGRLKISDRAHILFDMHQVGLRDALRVTLNF